MGHQTKVEYVSYHGGYPFRSTCVCGWKSKTYVSTDAAQMMADEHVANPAVRNLTVLV